jgi:hypothetical protein
MEGSLQGRDSAVPPENKTKPEGQNNSFNCLYRCPFLFFRVFGPEIACQAPKPPNPLKPNKIELAFKLPSTRYTRYRNQAKAPAKTGASRCTKEKAANLFVWNILDATPLFGDIYSSSHTIND